MEQGARYFAAGVRADPDLHYFVAPRAAGLVRNMALGKYCIVTGHRQSGKSTTVKCAANQAAEDTSAIPIIFAGGVPARKSWTEQQMWRCLCWLLHQCSPGHFPPLERSRQDYESLDFVDAFLLRPDQRNVRFMLIIDEADTLLKLDEDCIDELMHTLRFMKSEKDVYSLKCIVLVGTDRVMDLVEQRYHAAAKRPGYQGSKSSPSVHSPFPHDHAMTPVRFAEGDIRELLLQFVGDHPEAEVDVDAIAESIFELTAGHKGLAGACLAFMVQEEAFSVNKWKQLNNILVTHVFSLATYQKIMKDVRESETTNIRQHLREFVELHRVRYQLPDGPVRLREYIASGVLVVEAASQASSMYCYMTLSSPLLRMAILGRLRVTNFTLDKQPPSGKLETENDRIWVLETSLELLDGNILRSPEVWRNDDTPSEYSYQFAFMARLKAVLEQAYPLMQLKVLPEVREVPGLQQSLLRADTLVANGDGFQRFAFEFLVSGTLGSSGTLTKYYDKALIYAEQHSAKVYFVNITVDEAFQELVPDSSDVVFVGVEFTSRASTARLKVIYSGITPVVREGMLNLRRWTGGIDYDLL